MLLEAPPPDPSMERVKMFVSQPRRIAAKALVERIRDVEPSPIRDSVALRMGHGVREYETSKTQVWFVTTGYLVRLLANNPANFDDITHIVVDEVRQYLLFAAYCHVLSIIRLSLYPVNAITVVE